MSFHNHPTIRSSAHTGQDFATLLGQRMLMRIERFTVPVLVLDARSSYGRMQAQVEPIGGSGSAWVDADRLSPMEDGR